MKALDDGSRPAGPLSHLRICDLSGHLAGAGATKFLAAMGAEVIRVEDPVREGRWDILRGNPPFIDDRRSVELGGGFNNHNTEKYGVTINLRTEEGRALLRELIAKSDIVTENFAAGVFARLGFSYDEMQEIREDIIYVSNCGFGHSGPYREFKSWGPIVQAVCGLTATSRLPGEDLPAGYGFSYMDHHGANYMAAAILAAVHHRTRTGEGQWVDIACTEIGATMVSLAMLDHEVNQRGLDELRRRGSNRNRSPAMAPHGIFACAGDDNWVAIACRDDEDWSRLATVVGENWASNVRFDSIDGRLDAEDELELHLADWTGKHSPREVAEGLVSAGVPASIVSRPADRVDHDSSTAEWGLFPEVRHPEIGSVRVDGLPIHLSDSDWRIERPAPLLGQHNHLVLGKLLGHDESEIDDLRDRGVI